MSVKFVSVKQKFALIAKKLSSTGSFNIYIIIKNLLQLTSHSTKMRATADQYF